MVVGARPTDSPVAHCSGATVRPLGGAHLTDHNRPGAPVPDTTSIPPRRRTHVLDTSVLLADPGCLGRFDEHEVVLPVVVLTELEAKRHHPELGWAAREALRVLERLRVEHGSLTSPLPVNQAGGTLRVELNHQDTRGLPPALTADNNDHRILAVAHNLARPRAPTSSSSPRTCPCG